MAHDTGTYFKNLISLALSGDESAWGEIVDLITPVVIGICQSRQVSREETYDIYGQVCYLLLTNLKDLINPAGLIQYAATITKREILSLARRRKKQVDFLIFEYKEFSGESYHGTDKDIESSQLRELIITAIDRLPEKEAHLLKFLFLDPAEPSYEEIARKLKIPVSSIGPTRARGLKRLQKIIKKMGIKLFGIFLGFSILFIIR